MPHRRSLVLALSFLTPIATAFAQQPGSAGAFRTLASFTGERFAADPHVSPDGRFILLATRSELLVYDVATKRTTKLADGETGELEWSRKGDRIAWVRAGDDGSGEFVWSMPLDPKTATPAGPPQRVTIGQGEFPAISLDGQWIAYSAPETDAPGAPFVVNAHHLSVVPVTGGPERVLAHFDGGFVSPHWSADGKSIYVNGTVVGGKKAVVTKVFVDGSAPEVVRAGAGEWFAGMTADRRHIVLVPAKSPIAAGDRALVLDTTGKELGRVQLPIGTINEYDDVIGDSALVWVDLKDRRRLEIRSMSGGAPKQISVVGESNDAPTWSPDGKHIVFHVRENKHAVLAIMNADGSNVRVFHDTEVRDDHAGARWSPDSKFIGFSSQDWHRLTLLEVASGQFRTILNDTTIRVGNWIWRADSRSITAVMIRQAARRSIDEITLLGARRQLLDVGTLAAGTGFQFIDGATIAYRSDSAAFVVPLDGGGPRRLVDVPAKTRVSAMAVAHDRRWIAGPMWDPTRQEVNQIELISVESGQRRVIEVPFRLMFAIPPIFTAGDRSLLVFGDRADDTTSAKIYDVPLDGGAPRVVGAIGANPNRPSASASPNGQSIVYTIQENRTTALLLVDLRPVLSRLSLAPTHR